jgi:hemerythrin-like domain-containing protein
MNDTSNWLVHDHQRYEAALDECEIYAGAGDWMDAVRMFNSFVEDLKLHMRMEDEVLYPFFIEETGDPEDAITELGDEHDDLARLLNDLAYVIKTKDFDHFEESLLPLKKTMARHNRHEEAVLQRFEGDSLLTRRDEIMDRLHALDTKGNPRTWNF